LCLSIRTQAEPVDVESPLAFKFMFKVGRLER